MAMSKNELKDSLKHSLYEQIHEGMITKSVPLNKKGFKKEGSGTVDDYLESVKQDMLGTTFEQQLGSAAFMPTILDPQIYDNGTLYGVSPTLTYLESRGRRKPANSTSLEYIQMTAGFAGEWIGETANTVGTGVPTVADQTATMKYLAIPYSFSDMIGVGASNGTKQQLMNILQQALREEFNSKIVAGDSGTSGQFDGMFKTAAGNASRVNQNSTEVGEDDVEGLEVVMNDILKSYPTFISTSATVVKQIKKDLAAQQRIMDKTNAVLGLNLPAYASNRGDIPIVVDPYVPKTAGARRLGMFNENFIFIADLITPSTVQKGRVKPFALDGWMVQVSVEYNSYPGSAVDIYNIA